MKLAPICYLKATFLLLTFIFSGCGSSMPEENSYAAGDTATTTAPQKPLPAKDFFYSLPSPLLMVKVFKKTGLKYSEGVANPPESISRYSSVQSKALNLGVYSADLAYTVLNRQSQEAIHYIESVKHLSDDLGMSSLFTTDDYLKRFKTNLDNEDSLIGVVCELKSEMDIFMKDNDKEKQTLLIFIGAWVENMYIATQLTKEANKEKVAMRIAEQKYVLNSLMNVGANFQTDTEFKTLYLSLSELKTLFDNLTVRGEAEKISMDDLQLKAITEKTSNIRKEIVG
jgi:hypothetical protein